MYKEMVRIAIEANTPVKALYLYRELERRGFQFPRRTDRVATSFMLQHLRKSKLFDRIGSQINRAHWWPRGHKQK